MFMTTQLYRKAVIFVIAGCASFTLAQTAAPNKTKPRVGPRAISVLEVDARNQPRMVPVAIIYYDKYYDASQYQANPVPMAAEPGNVYDVLQANLPFALFTTAQPQEVHGNWITSGVLKQHKDEPEKKPEKQTVTLADDKGGPVLHRKGESKPADTGGSPSDNDPDRPTLKRPADQQSSGSSQPSSAPTSSGSDDSDRPTLKRPSDSNSSTQTTAKTTAAPVDKDLTRDTNENDPDRPVLRKTDANTNPTDVTLKMTAPAGPPRVAAPAKVAPESGAAQLKQYVAISDAEKTDYRPFAYDLKPEDRTRLAPKLQKIAADALRKFALAHGAVKLLPTLTFTDFDIRAFDVDYSNNPELVFTASFSPTSTAKTKPVTYYLTLVAREDANTDLTPLFSMITDSTRLDEYPRLELIDAVDADGYGRGSLLFREFNADGKAFVLYRVDAYNLTKLFEGASGE